MLYRSTLPRGWFHTWRAVLAGLAAAAPLGIAAAPKTVCTITINSPDERVAFERHLPRGDYRFVELVKQNQPDWFGQACRSGVQCDALIISGHFDDGSEFYTDRLGNRESLPMQALETASCSNSCSGVLAQVKEVYLFGCNTLKTEARHVAEGEILRSLTRSGLAVPEAQRVSAALNARYGQSNQDRLRAVFKDVPLLYGFSANAPLGHVAGPLLDRYFETAPAGEVASGRPSETLLKLFGPASMIASAGLTASDPNQRFRQDMCAFADARPAQAAKVAFLHHVLQRDVTEVRMFLTHIERYAHSISPADRAEPEVAAAMARIRNDHATRDRFLAFARDVDQAAVQVRMMALARAVEWLTPEQEHASFLEMLADRIARGDFGKTEVDLACAAPQGPNPGEAVHALKALAATSLQAGNVSHSAALACLGDRDAHGRVVQALVSSNDNDVAMAQAYFRHRRLSDTGELRTIASGIGRMTTASAQVRALEALARQRLADPQSLKEIADLFPRANSLEVQRAIAGILIRSDYRSLGAVELARSLRQHRIKSPDGGDVIDMLIRLLQMT